VATESIPIKLHSVRELGDLLRSKRKQAGYPTLTAGAEACSVGKRFLSELERGKVSAEIGKILDVLHGLGLNLAVIDSPMETTSPELNQTSRSHKLGLDFPYDWSNPAMSEESFIDAVLKKARFLDVLRLVRHFGMERIETQAGHHLTDHPNWPRLKQILERIRAAKIRAAAV